MSETKFTPGTAIVCNPGDYGDYDGNCFVLLNEAGDLRVAVVLGAHDEARANAHLFASSSALYAELLHLVRLMEPLEDCGQLDIPGLATLNGARAALAKARGEQ